MSTISNHLVFNYLFFLRSLKGFIFNGLGPCRNDKMTADFSVMIKNGDLLCKYIALILSQNKDVILKIV